MNKTMLAKLRLCRVVLSLLPLMLCALPLSGQARGEYFWNSDPGIGRASRMVHDGETDGYHAFTIDASSLQPGMNMLGLRAYSGGRWTQTYYSLVMVEADPAAVKWSGEYFWNSDPGVGKATPLPMDGAAGGQIVAEIPAGALGSGANTLGLRVNSGGVWSQTHTYLVAVPADPQAADWRAEYFWDDDPGVGLATPLGVALGASGGMVDVELLTDGLAPGQHTIGFRTCSGSAWSPTVTSIVTVKDNRRLEIIGAEYFWGSDPGFGNGTPIEIKPGEAVAVEDLEIDFPQTVADEYVLSFRARSPQGWGTTVTRVIPHLYVGSVELKSGSALLPVGASMQIESVVTPADAFVADLVWESSDPSVAVVDAGGSVTGVAPGRVVITATSTDGTEVAGTLELTVLVPVTGIVLSDSELTLEVSRSATLGVTVTPAGATDTGVVWSIEGDNCVTVSDEGVITATAPGEATVVATAADGYGASAGCRVRVTHLRGDADGSGALAVNDVVLTARGVVGDIDRKLVMEAVDMNADGNLTVGDLSMVVGAVLDYTALPAALAARAPALDADGGQLDLWADGMTVAVKPADHTRFCGLQFDVAVSDGLSVGDVQLAEGVADGHSVALAVHGRSTRALSYATAPYLPSADGTVARIMLSAASADEAGEYVVDVTNVMASDVDGNLYRLADRSIAVVYDPMSGLRRVAADGLEISVDGHTVTIESPADTVVTFTDMRGISRRIEINAGTNTMTVGAAGVYVVDGQKIIIR